MRISEKQHQIILDIVQQLLGQNVRIRLFGSRTDDQKKGGDIDLLIELDEPVMNPAEISARLSARLMRAMHGRKVDVLLLASNLSRSPIHDIALRQGIIL
ncbi:nucleotidyltransferase domain-containing protein [Marinospirillum alkaliphilum]|uniref:Nucleotidyltransferase domain-containing protein n=1 Tax=Marinospirillum alkaliphilum DSM 21637 TaxID=1122209 RepID=A0A1K1UAR6_9GAMM|nr:nucleotidyltransferase domain-containing protein [Marinospirillum alkaliphilum]SFX09927.1 Nucleotidyltransferase domain-containing protein [Marinospirillum alkaliphilum DSM 21637]